MSVVKAKLIGFVIGNRRVAIQPQRLHLSVAAVGEIGDSVKSSFSRKWALNSEWYLRASQSETQGSESKELTIIRSLKMWVLLECVILIGLQVINVSPIVSPRVRQEKSLCVWFLWRGVCPMPLLQAGRQAVACHLWEWVGGIRNTVKPQNHRVQWQGLKLRGWCLVWTCRGRLDPVAWIQEEWGPAWRG